MGTGMILVSTNTVKVAVVMMVTAVWGVMRSHE